VSIVVKKQMQEILNKYYSKTGHCQLCPLANKEGVIHFYNCSSDQNKILIFQNPKEGRSEEDKERSMRIKDSMMKRDLDELVEVSQKAFVEWKTNFFPRFFRVLKKHNLVDFETFDKYMLTRNLFRDFYITDVVKCVAQTKAIYGKPELYCSEYLKGELFEKISRTQKKRLLIVTFGNVAYRFFHKSKIFKLRKVNQKSELPPKVTKRNGYLHLYTCESTEGGKKELYVIHLTHLSERARIFTLRESYFDYLEEGLQSYRELAHS